MLCQLGTHSNHQVHRDTIARKGLERERRPLVFISRTIDRIRLSRVTHPPCENGQKGVRKSGGWPKKIGTRVGGRRRAVRVVRLFALARGAAFEPPHAARPLSFPFDDYGTSVQFHTRSAVLVAVVVGAAQDQIGPDGTNQTNVSKCLSGTRAEINLSNWLKYGSLIC